jgi:hypothetical protein
VLRFLIQESYEQAAPMLISPAPDVVTRSFMLFRGVASPDLELWQSAGTLVSTVVATDSATSWVQVLSVDAARAPENSAGVGRDGSQVRECNLRSPNGDLQVL